MLAIRSAARLFCILISTIAFIYSGNIDAQKLNQSTTGENSPVISAGGDVSIVYGGVNITKPLNRNLICAAKPEASCNEAMEAAQRVRLKKFFKRVDGVLIINLSNGKSRRFVDNNSAGEQAVKYNILEYFDEIGSVLIGGSHWEWSSYTLINLFTGQEVVSLTYPEFSPVYRHMILFGDEWGCDKDPIYKIYSWDGQGFVKTKDFRKIDDCAKGSYFLKWLAEDEFLFSHEGGEVSLKYRNGVWSSLQYRWLKMLGAID